MKEALEHKKTALLLLVSAQRDLETHSSFLIEDQGLEKTIRFHDAHFAIGDHDTAVGRFLKAAASLTLRTHRPAANSQALVCNVTPFIVPSLIHHHLEACVCYLILSSDSSCMVSFQLQNKHHCE